MPKITKTISKAFKKADPLSSLRIKLKATQPEIQNYVRALEAENLKLHKYIAKLQADNISLKNRVKVLEKNHTKYIHNNPPFVFSPEGEKRLIEISEALLDKKRSDTQQGTPQDAEKRLPHL